MPGLTIIVDNVSYSASRMILVRARSLKLSRYISFLENYFIQLRCSALMILCINVTVRRLLRFICFHKYSVDKSKLLSFKDSLYESKLFSCTDFLKQSTLFSLEDYHALVFTIN